MSVSSPSNQRSRQSFYSGESLFSLLLSSPWLLFRALFLVLCSDNSFVLKPNIFTVMDSTDGEQCIISRWRSECDATKSLGTDFSHLFLFPSVPRADTMKRRHLNLIPTEVVCVINSVVTSLTLDTSALRCSAADKWYPQGNKHGTKDHRLWVSLPGGDCKSESLLQEP